MSDVSPNAGQIAHWNDSVGQTWVKFQEGLDRQLAPIGAAALSALGAKPGERILDIGCGAGATTLEIARAVGETGSVVGADISEPLLASARRRPVPEGAARPEFVAADAQVFAFPAAGFDAVFSRFGVMFFSDFEAAFANLRRATRPGGRLAFVCWRGVDENQWMTLPVRAAADIVPPPEPGPPGAPGPFALADPDLVRRILANSGWLEVGVEPLDLAIGAGGADDAARLMTRVGPLGASLREAGAARALVDAAEARVRKALEDHLVDGQVRIASGSWIVTATA